MNIYNESGQLSEEGKKATQPLVAMVNDLLSMGKTASEKRLIGSLISSIVGNITADQVLKT